MLDADLGVSPVEGRWSNLVVIWHANDARVGPLFLAGELDQGLRVEPTALEREREGRAAADVVAVEERVFVDGSGLVDVEEELALGWWGGYPDFCIDVCQGEDVSCRAGAQGGRAREREQVTWNCWEM